MVIEQVLIQAVFSVELALSLNSLELPEQGPVCPILHLYPDFKFHLRPFAENVVRTAD